MPQACLACQAFLHPRHFHPATLPTSSFKWVGMLPFNFGTKPTQNTEKGWPKSWPKEKFSQAVREAFILKQSVVIWQPYSCQMGRLSYKSCEIPNLYLSLLKRLNSSLSYNASSFPPKFVNQTTCIYNWYIVGQGASAWHSLAAHQAFWCGLVVMTLTRVPHTHGSKGVQAHVQARGGCALSQCCVS